MDKIKNFSGKYDFLSNFYPCSIVYNGYPYTSVEAAFQSEKCADPRDCVQFTELSARDAKRLGRKVELREDWEERKLDVMWELLCIKFLNYPELLAKLLQTDIAFLVEGNTWHDNFWGTCSCERCSRRPGANKLGRLLMSLRNTMYLGQRPDEMPKPFSYMGVEVEPLRLFSMPRVLSLIHYNGASSETLDLIRERYRSLFGAELIWRYPIFDATGDGGVLIPVREGFLWLPYDEDGAEPTEYYCVKEAHLLDQDSVRTLLRELNSYTDGLRAALSEMLPPLGGVMRAKDEPVLTLTLPDGNTLRSIVSHDAEYPAIRIDLVRPSATTHPEPICFAEYNPNRPEGHQLCICAYTEDNDDPDYYRSYTPCEDDQSEE